MDNFFRARDDPEGAQVMLGQHDGGTDRTRTLLAARKGLWTDVAAVPMEDCHVLDEKLLTGMGYSLGDTLYLERLAGDTVTVRAESGQYSGAVAELAAQLGCRVLALTRWWCSVRAGPTRSSRCRPTVYEATSRPGDLVSGLAALRPGARAVVLGAMDGRRALEPGLA